MIRRKTRLSVLLYIILTIFTSQVSAVISDHVLHIEMSTTYKFGTSSMAPIEYCFDAWMEVDNTVVSGTVETPGGIVYTAELEIDSEGRWLGIGHCSGDLNDLVNFTEGTYIFTINYSGGGSDSTTVDYSLQNGDPIPPVDQPLEATYPVNGAVDVPTALLFELVPLSDPNWTYGVIWVPADDNPNAISGQREGLPYTTTSVGPIVLSPNTSYEVELNAGHVIHSVNGDGIPYVVDMDSERFLYFTTRSIDWHLYDDFSNPSLSDLKWHESWHQDGASDPAVSNEQLVLEGSDTDGLTPPTYEDYAENGVQANRSCSGVMAEMSFASCITHHDPNFGESPYGQIKMEADLKDALGNDYDVSIEFTEEGEGLSGEIELTRQLIDAEDEVLQTWDIDVSYDTKYTFRILINEDQLLIYMDNTLVGSYSVDPTSKIKWFTFKGEGTFCSYQGTVDNVYTTSSTGVLIDSPASNSRWAKGRTYTIKWATSNLSKNVKISLFKGDSKVLTIKDSTANDGSCSWKVPTSLSKRTNYRIKVVCRADKTVYGYSDNFEICSRCDLYTPIEVSDPNSESEWEMGDDYSIEWTGGESTQKVKIQLFKGSTLKKTITDKTANDGQYDFKVPYTLTPASNYRIKIKVLGSDCSILSDYSSYFEIEAPEIDVDEPDDDSVWMMGASYPITWSGDYFPGDVQIKLYKGSKAVKTIKDSTTNDGSYTWSKVSYSLSQGSNYRIKVISKKNKYIKGYSDYFEIAMPPINVTSPTSDTEWKRGYTHTIRWTGGNPSKSVKIKLLKPGKDPVTIASSTANDGVHKWKVPSKLGLGDDYTIKVIYLPNTAIQDTSDTFTVINSPVGTWKGLLTSEEDESLGLLKLVVKSDGTFTAGDNTATFKGKYTYNFESGGFDGLARDYKWIKGYLVRLNLNVSGVCVNHTMEGNYSFTGDIKLGGHWEQLDEFYMGGTFKFYR